MKTATHALLGATAHDPGISGSLEGAQGMPTGADSSSTVGRGDWTVIELDGEIDLARVDDLAQIIEQSWLPTQNLLIDFSPVNFIDSTGVRWLFDIRQQMTLLDREMRLVAPQGSQIKRLLELVGAREAFTVDDSLEQAWKKIKGDGPCPQPVRPSS
ncbi:MAG TPA: STAS domain-containing protein [Acidimicrobiia bacterium]|nr:STAS domain-containing protein [Acidimicrobiia bacterium]